MVLTLTFRNSYERESVSVWNPSYSGLFVSHCTDFQIVYLGCLWSKMWQWHFKCQSISHLINITFNCQEKVR